MTDDPADLRASDLLAAMGTVQPPEPRILEHAREVLWSAVASEMLGTGPAGEQTTAGQASDHKQHDLTTRQYLTDRSPDEGTTSM
jgi:hypothetical protein